MDSDRGAGSERTGGRAGQRAILLRYGLGLAALGAVAFFFVRERRLFAGFGATLAHLNSAWVVIAFAAELASVPPLAEAQRKVLAAGGVASDRMQMNLVTLASNAISASVPAGVAVAEGYSFVRYRRFGADTAVPAWSELAIGAITFCALATLALAGAVIAGGGAESILLPLLGVVLGGSARAALLFRHPLFMVRSPGLDRGAPGAGRPVARQAHSGLPPDRPLAWARAPLAGPVGGGLGAVGGQLTAGRHLPSAVVCGGPRPGPMGGGAAGVCGLQGGGSIGITPGGLGIVEAGLVATFVAYGVPGAHAGAAVLVYRALTLVGLVGIGWLSVALLAVEDRRHARSSRGPRLATAPAKRAQQRRKDP
jgi:uncharacterized membrane protein YbhN (UPF0104 family)